MELHVPDPEDPLGVLAQIGGLENELRWCDPDGAVYASPFILDGVVRTPPALVAWRPAPHSAGYVVAGQRSPRQGCVSPCVET